MLACPLACRSSRSPWFCLVRSTFHFTIRVLGSFAQPAPYLRGEHPQLVGKTAWIVDDNEMSGKMLCETLATWGVSTRYFRDAKSAFKALLRAKPPNEPDATVEPEEVEPKVGPPALISIALRFRSLSHVVLAVGSHL